MKITTRNYYDTIENVNVKTLPPDLQSSHELVDKVSKQGKSWNMYLRNSSIQETIDIYFGKLDEYIASLQKPTIEKTENSKKPEKETASHSAKKSTNQKPKPPKSTTRKPKPKKKQINPNATGVEHTSLENKIIKRYVNLNGKVKTKDQIRLFLNYIQKAIAEKRLTRADARYPDVLNKIQTKLVDLFNRTIDTTSQIQLDPKDHNKYLEILGEEYLMTSVRFIMSYLRLQGKTIDVDKAKRLHNRIGKAVNDGVLEKCDKYWKEVQTVLKSLKDFVAGGKESGMLPIQASELSGLEGILEGCGCDSSGDGLKGFDGSVASTPKHTIMNSTDIVNLKFDKLGFMGKWLDFIGDPAAGFTMMVSAKPKYGKSYLCVDFAGYLARNHGRVLYVAKEEGIDDTLQQKLKDKNVAHPDLDVADFLPDNLGDYDFVFLDSVTKLKLTPDQLEELRRKNPSVSFIFIFQVTKNGMFRGANDYAHDVDSLVEIPEKGFAVQNGRFNQGGEMEIFEDAA